MSEERRANPNPLEISGILSILYTAGYLVMVGMLYFVEIPTDNKEPLLQLFGLMSAIQMALISFHFGSSKSAESTQRAIEQRQGRSEAVVQEIARTVPAAAAAAAAAPVAEPGPEGTTRDPLSVEIHGKAGIETPLKVDQAPRAAKKRTTK